MKSVLIAACFVNLLTLGLRAQTPADRELETLKAQRDKALETATNPIHEKYIAALEALLERTLPSGENHGDRLPVAQSCWNHGESQITGTGYQSLNPRATPVVTGDHFKGSTVSHGPPPGSTPQTVSGTTNL